MHKTEIGIFYVGVHFVCDMITRFFAIVLKICVFIVIFYVIYICGLLQSFVTWRLMLTYVEILFLIFYFEWNILCRNCLSWNF